MSDQDSFIAEVNDAVREDQLYGYLRRYGWIAALAIVILVGGAAWNEYSKAQTVAAAKALGDDLLAAVQQDDAGARAEALAGVQAEGAAAAVPGLMTAAAQVEAGNIDAALEVLDAMGTNEELGPIYRDVALFKSALLDEGDARASKLEALAQPGGSFRLLAQEQLALMKIENADVDGAIDGLRRILEDAEVTQSLQERAQTLIVALGAPLEEDASDTE